VTVETQRIALPKATHNQPSEAVRHRHRHAGMSRSTYPAAAGLRRHLKPGSALRRWLWHYVEMNLAMTVGMLGLGLVRMLVTPSDLAILYAGNSVFRNAAMAVFMTVPMVMLMRHHGYTWRQCLQMSAAMLAPSAVLLGFGLAETHLAMMLGMAIWMLYRRREYA
jgi:hypothetical protein